MWLRAVMGQRKKTERARWRGEEKESCVDCMCCGDRERERRWGKEREDEQNEEGHVRASVGESEGKKNHERDKMTAQTEPRCKTTGLGCWSLGTLPHHRVSIVLKYRRKNTRQQRNSYEGRSELEWFSVLLLAALLLGQHRSLQTHSFKAALNIMSAQWLEY